MRHTAVVAAMLTVARVAGARPLRAQGTRATLRGTVRTAAGAPRANVTVNIVNLDNQNERQAISEEDGAWTVGGLLPGRYEIRIDETGFQPFRSGAIALAAGQQRAEDIRLTPVGAPAAPAPAPPPPAAPAPAAQGARATLRGTVRAGGAPRANVTVNVVNLDTQNERQAITESDGTFTVGGLVPGRYEIRIEESGLPPFRSPAITLTAGQQATQEIALGAAAQPATPAGTRPNQPPPPPPAPPVNPNARASLKGTVKAAGVAAPNITVNVVNLDNKNERQAISESDGTYSLGGLPPGRYQLHVEDKALSPYRSDTITLAPGQQATADIPLAIAVADYIPSPDRWHLEFPVWKRYADVPGVHPFVDRSKLGPYKQTALKGDYPAFGTRTCSSCSPGCSRHRSNSGACRRRAASVRGSRGRMPSSGSPSSGRWSPKQSARFEIFKGDTSFKPRTWAFRATPVFNLNYTNTKEYNVVNATPEEKATRRRQDIALQEAFGELKLARRRSELRLHLGARRHSAVHERLPRLPVSRHQPRRAPVRHGRPQQDAVERRRVRSAARRKPTAS